jgi:hypothetical protein
MKYIIHGLVFFALSLVSVKSNAQQASLKSSYELSNSNQWLNIPGGFASFVQFDYNKDGRDDVVLFEGYDINKTYTWPGPVFYKNTATGLVKDNVTIDYKKIFAGKELAGDFNNDGYLDAFLLTGMDPAGCNNCKDPVFPLYTMKNVDGTSFKVDSINYKGVWRTGTSADIDNDGDLDIVAFSTHHEYAGDILNRILLNDSKGNFTYKASNIDSIGWVDRSELIDMNNDGFVDLLINDVYSPTNVYANRFRILWNNKKGEFNQDNSVTIAIPNDYYVTDINAFDINKDGIKEIILPMNDVTGKWKIFIYQSTNSINYNEVSNSLIQNNYSNNVNLWDEPMAIYDLDNNGLTDILLNNKTNNIRWEWNGTAFIRKLDINDIDDDGITDAVDNCKNMYNPFQEDLDKNNIGDACEWSPILLKKTVSILEDLGVNSSLSVGDFMLDSVSKYVTYGDGDYKTYFTISNNKISIKTSVSSYSKEYFKVPVKYNKNAVTINDTITIYIIRYLNWPKNTGKLQNGYIPYYYESYSNGMTGLENTKFGPNQFFRLSNQAAFLIQDIDNNGINDIVGQSTQIWYPPISDTSKNKQMYNNQRTGIPAYVKFDSAFNATYYHENFRNPDVLWHQPDFFEQVDLNKDGKKEVLNFGEHYHTEYFLDDQNPTLAKNILGKQVLKYLGMIENRDYNQQTAGKLSRYYTFENGRLVDKKDNYNYSKLNFDQSQPPYISNSKFVSIFGSAYGDIDNDGDIDYIQSVNAPDGYIDVLVNDGMGNFALNRQKPANLNYSTGPEGKNMLVDINGDGYLDYFFGGSRPIANTNQNELFLGYILNNKRGGFVVDTLNDLGSFGSKNIAPKYMFVEDLDKDNKKEIIVYRSTGLGSGGNGTANLDFINDILILTIDNGKIIENTNKFIDTLSRSKMYSQDSHFYFEDLDGDKIKDLFIKYDVDSSIVKPYMPFYGYWEKNYNGFSYFKGSKEGKFKYTRLGKFVLQDGFKNWYSSSESSDILSNKFELGDIDNDGTSELMHHPSGGTNLIIFKIYDCIKPTLKISKSTICQNDSTSIKLTNKTLGSSYVWYYNNDSVSKTTDSIFIKTAGVLRLRVTDSLGCTKFSDSIAIKVTSNPSAPTLSRDTANFLLSGAAGTTWYKDGSAITDTAQKYKPATPGSYTAKTTTNGCTSVMSSAYYYLVTDIINLSKDEFIKLAPNPFINQLNFDFIVKGYQKLNIEVFDVATGTKVASQPNLTAGSRITLGQLSGGTYIIRVTSNDQKILQQFKVVKM